ncbi:MAG: LysM peptidoglycan-binding domain-containing protein [Planctomycetes bacterium]|nr:LysM peptidoglycan-binding domain-containing protein [Planctomycetota bacterium]
MRNNILTILVGFVVMLGSVMLFKLGLDKMTDADAASTDAYAQVNVDMNRRAILYRVQSGDTLWSLAERFYGAGRRWQEIARANDLSNGDGLVAGAIIKIPLGDQDEFKQQPEETQPLPTASYDEVEEAVNAGRFGLDDETIDVAMCRVNRVEFPAGALCVARNSEQQTVRLSLFDAANDGSQSPLAVYEAPKGNYLRELHSEDLDGDGEQEIYTIWQTENDPCTSRVLKWADGKLDVVAETPDDPLALLRLRNRD